MGCEIYYSEDRPNPLWKATANEAGNPGLVEHHRMKHLLGKLGVVDGLSSSSGSLNGAKHTAASLSACYDFSVAVHGGSDGIIVA